MLSSIERDVATGLPTMTMTMLSSKFWADHEFSHPTLYRIARRVFGALLATEANCERMFSRSGAILSAKRMQMEPELASATTVLSKEHELFAISAKDFGAFMIDGAGDDDG